MSALIHAGEVSMGPEINVGSFLTTTPFNQYQSDLRCHPTDPNRMVITAKNGYEEHTVAFTTVNGGTSWTVSRQNASGDPDCFYGNNGWAHWFYMDRTPRRMGYRRSKQADGVWEAARHIGLNYLDHPHVFVDRNPESPYVGSIYYAGRLASEEKIEVIRSRDNGDTWASSVFNTGPDFAKGFVYGPPVVMADGTIVITGEGQNRILSVGGVYAGSRRDIFAFRSTDGGVTFSSPIFICDLNGVVNGRGGANAIGTAIVRVNNIERIIIVLSRVRSNQPSVLQIVSSDDGGRTWTSPRNILEPYPNNNWSAGGMISVTVNADGVIGLQYINESDTSSAFNVMFIWSGDGGDTWSTPLQVNSVANTEPIWSSQSRAPGGDQVYGDTAADGTFRLVWPDHRTGDNVYRLYTRSVTVSAQEAENYAVTYDANGATGGTAPGEQTKTHGVNLALSANTGGLVRTGFTFSGWNTAANGFGTNYAEGATYTANAGVTLYAKWIAPAEAPAAAFWNLNEWAVGLTTSTSANAILDVHPANKGLHLTASHAFPVVSGAPDYGAGRALDFNANGGLFISDAASANAFDYRATDSFTIEIVCRVPNGSTQVGGLVAKDVGPLSPAWWLRVENGKARFLVSDTGAEPNVSSSVNINDGAWHHIAAVRDASNPASKRLKIYVNGQLAGDVADTTTQSLANANSLWVGSFNNSTRRFTGAIDFVRITPGVLVPEQFAGAHTQLDADADLIPDAYERERAGSLSVLGAGTGDADGNGVPDYVEYSLGSDLLNAASGPLMRVEPGTGQIAVIYHERELPSWLSVELEHSLDLVEWGPTAGTSAQILLGDGIWQRTHTVTFPNGVPDRIFFRTNVMVDP